MLFFADFYGHYLIICFIKSKMLKYNILCLLLTWIKVVALEPDCHVLDVGPAWGQSLKKAVVQVSLELGFV